MSPNRELRVDIVYLWVNGSDPVWRRKRQHAAEKLSVCNRNSLALYSNVEGRFRDNDELRYSLRALVKFFPDHGHIYVVTDNQAPAWLKPSSQLTLVDHRDLIPADKLPTFDSGNIESYIHRIPNLSERYFYFNDDVFFGAPVRLEDWFYDGGTYVAWSDDPLVTNEAMRADATSLENACRLSHQWLNAQAAARTASNTPAVVVKPYVPVFRTFAHSPRPMLKSRMFKLEALAESLFEGVRSTVFRVWDKPTIVSDFVLRWALAHGQSRVCEHSHLYVSTGEGAVGDLGDLEDQLKALVDAAGRLDFFCINDTTDDALSHDPRLGRVREVLQEMFPVPSAFEKPS
ncbi:MAG: Stealth CR1 domain-containing protein, partial [Polaromonas sp.]|nr:Stealth CR1 domain-containing protein [Polaromonas sp.]